MRETFIIIVVVIIIIIINLFFVDVEIFTIPINKLKPTSRYKNTIS